MLTRRLCLVDGMSRLLNNIVNQHNTCLRVNGLYGLGVSRTLTLEQKVWEHVAMVTHKERVRHKGQLL